MQTPSQTDQDHFGELRINDFELSDTLSTVDFTDVITRGSEGRAIEIEEILHLLMFFTRQKRRTAATAKSASNTAGISMLPHTALPPPSRYTRKSRAAAAAH
jgi:hypothetical protein